MSLSKINVNNTQVASVDEQPTKNSNELVQSGGVVEYIKEKVPYSIINSGDYVEQTRDLNNRLIMGTLNDGTVEIQKLKVENFEDTVEFSAKQSPNYLEVLRDSEERIIHAVCQDGSFNVSKLVADSFKNDILYITDSKIEQAIESIENPVKEINNQQHLLQNIRLFESWIHIGDSVTDGHIFWNGNGAPVTRPWSYPTQLKKMYPELNIVNAGFSGISIKGWNTSKFNDYDFTQFMGVTIELGYNATPDSLTDTFDTDVAPYGDNYQNYADTAMGNYCQLIKKIQNAHPGIFIVLISSRSFNQSRLQAIQRISQEWNIPYMNLADMSLYPLNFEDCNVDLEVPGVHASPWGYLLKATYVALGIGRAIDEYHADVVKKLFIMKDWIWKITLSTNNPNISFPQSYVECVDCYTVQLTCNISSGTFTGWYYGDTQISTSQTFELNTYKIQALKYQTPRAITIEAR